MGKLGEIAPIKLKKISIVVFLIIIESKRSEHTVVLSLRFLSYIIYIL